MAIPKAHYCLAIIVILFAVSNSQNVCNPHCKAKEPFNCDNTVTFNRSGFPKNFVFGAATSAYQVYDDPQVKINRIGRSRSNTD